MIVIKTTIRISGNEIMTIDDNDIYICYVDMWKGPSERLAMAYLQGIGKNNVLKHRTGAADATSNEEDQAIATAFGKRFCFRLDFELLKYVTCLFTKPDWVTGLNMS